MNSAFRPLTTSEDRIAFPAQSSVLDENSLRHRVLPTYQIPPVTLFRFFERGDSDIYRAATAQGDFYLKIYRPPHSLEHAESEARCMAALFAAGLPILKPIARMDGSFACELAACEGPRPVLLFEAAPPPLPFPLNDELARKFGQAVAVLHQTADRLQETFAFPHLAFPQTAEEQLEPARPFLAADDYAYLLNLGARFYPQLPHQEAASDYGLCHGDLVNSNIRYSETGKITFFDFGRAYYGSRSYELSLCLRTVRAGNEATWPALWGTFLQGYNGVRPAPANMDAVFPAFAIYCHLNALGNAAEACPLRMGEEMIKGFLPQAVATAHQLEAATK